MGSPASGALSSSRVSGCTRGTCGLFGLENTSEVTKPKVCIIHSRHFPFPCPSSLPDKGCQSPSCPEHSKSFMDLIHSPHFCPRMAQEMGRVIPVLFPGLVLDLPEQGDFPGKLGISFQAAPLPGLRAVFAIPSLQQLIKAPSKAVHLRNLSLGSCHSPKGQRSQGKQPHPTPRSRGWKRSSWEQPGSSSKQKPFQK